MFDLTVCWLFYPQYCNSVRAGQSVILCGIFYVALHSVRSIPFEVVAFMFVNEAN